MTTEISDIDLIYPKWHNNIAIISGTLTSLVTTVVLARLGEAIASHFIDWDNSRLAKGAVLLGAFGIGVAAGHVVTAHAIGLIAKSAMAKFSVSLTFNCIGAIAGMAIYTGTRGWI